MLGSTADDLPGVREMDEAVGLVLARAGVATSGLAGDPFVAPADVVDAVVRGHAAAYIGRQGTRQPRVTRDPGEAIQKGRRARMAPAEAVLPGSPKHLILFPAI